MSSSSKLLQLLLRLLLLAGLLIVAAASGKSKHQELGKHMQIRALSKLDLNYVIKRKIPNGPDPIHNRRTGNSRQPPGRA